MIFIGCEIMCPSSHIPYLNINAISIISIVFREFVFFLRLIVLNKVMNNTVKAKDNHPLTAKLT